MDGHSLGIHYSLEGWALYSYADDGLFVYDGTAWVYIGPNPEHNLLAGLQGGSAGEYYHFTEAEHTALVDIVTMSMTVEEQFIFNYTMAMI